MAAARSTARRYAEAAFQIAERDGSVDTWLDAFATVVPLLAEPGLARLLANPAVPFEARRGLLDRLLGERITGAPARLTHLLVQRGRVEQLPDVAREFRRLHARQMGIVQARITSATALTDAEVATLRERLATTTGGRIEVTLDIDPALLGGLQVRLGDRLIDGSVRGRLERLRSKLASGAL